MLKVRVSAILGAEMTVANCSALSQNVHTPHPRGFASALGRGRRLLGCGVRYRLSAASVRQQHCGVSLNRRYERVMTGDVIDIPRQVPAHFLSGKQLRPSYVTRAFCRKGESVVKRRLGAIGVRHRG